MSAFDDDPEYEAQLKDVLGDDPGWQPREGDDEFGDQAGDISEDDVLDDAPTFRRTFPREGDKHIPKDDDLEMGEERLLSEDTRSISTGDDSPSIQGSEATLSAPTTPSKLNGYGYLSPARAFSPSRRFDIRQHQRLSSFSSLPPRSGSPSSVHSRMSSFSSNIADVNDITPSDSPHVPWEVVRWTKLRKIGTAAFSEVGKRKFGTPTAMAVFL